MYFPPTRSPGTGSGRYGSQQNLFAFVPAVTGPGGPATEESGRVCLPACVSDSARNASCCDAIEYVG